MEDELSLRWKPWADLLDAKMLLPHFDSSKVGYTRYLEPYFSESECLISGQIYRLRWINKCEVYLCSIMNDRLSQRCLIDINFYNEKLLHYLTHPEEQE